MGEEPTPLDMVTALHRALYGDVWARPESPQQIWEKLLADVRGLAAGQCGECMRRAGRPLFGAPDLGLRIGD